tara:strand:+ start:68 stop:784 length:717 start_codon:yes stop_codon:yes gene_type:complete
MRGHRAHIKAAAYHESGHALAALRVGRYVSRIVVDHGLPGNGVMSCQTPGKNPFNLADGAGNAMAAWNYTYQTTLDAIFVSLAGPLSEAKLLGKPLRLMGNKSDLNYSIYLCARLQRLSKFASDYTDVPPIDVKLLNQMRDKVRRWINRPKTWAAITEVSEQLALVGHIDGDILGYVIGASQGTKSGQKHMLRNPRRKSVIGQRTGSIVSLRFPIAAVRKVSTRPRSLPPAEKKSAVS